MPTLYKKSRASNTIHFDVIVVFFMQCFNNKTNGKDLNKTRTFMKYSILKVFTTERLLYFCILCHVFMKISIMKRRCNWNKAMANCSISNPVITFKNLSSHSGSLEHTAGWVRQRIKGIRSRTSCSLKVKSSLQNCFESCFADTHIQNLLFFESGPLFRNCYKWLLWKSATGILWWKRKC